jgi:hypothetical protein
MAGFQRVSNESDRKDSTTRGSISSSAGVVLKDCRKGILAALARKGDLEARIRGCIGQILSSF